MSNLPIVRKLTAREFAKEFGIHVTTAHHCATGRRDPRTGKLYMAMPSGWAAKKGENNRDWWFIEYGHPSPDPMDRQQPENTDGPSTNVLDEYLENVHFAKKMIELCIVLGLPVPGLGSSAQENQGFERLINGIRDTVLTAATEKSFAAELSRRWEQPTGRGLSMPEKIAPVKGPTPVDVAWVLNGLRSMYRAAVANNQRTTLRIDFLPDGTCTIDGYHRADFPCPESQRSTIGNTLEALVTYIWLNQIRHKEFQEKRQDRQGADKGGYTADVFLRNDLRTFADHPAMRKLKQRCLRCLLPIEGRSQKRYCGSSCRASHAKWLHSISFEDEEAEKKVREKFLSPKIQANLKVAAGAAHSDLPL